MWYTEAQTMFFCFEGFEAGTCSGGLIASVASPEECCFTPGRGGHGGGAYVAAGDERCFNCMTIIGEGEISSYISS